MSDSLTRRTFVQRGGTALALFNVAAFGWPELLEAASAAEPGFTSMRRTTYRALVKAVGQAPGTRVDGDRDALAADRFGSWYRGQSSVVQRHVEGVLDYLEEGRGVSRKNPREGYAALSEWLSARTPAEREFEREAEREAPVGHPSEPGGLPPFLQQETRRIAARVEQIRREHGAEALELDPETGLQRYQPPVPHRQVTTSDEELRTPEARRRYLAATAIGLAELPFDDGEVVRA